MADIFRITGELAEHADVRETLDGREKNREASIKRLARMFAIDISKNVSENEVDLWLGVAKQVRTMQIQLIKDACRHQLMKKAIPLNTPIIGAVVGRFLSKTLATELGREYIDFENLFNIDMDDAGFNVSDCAPAAALACLFAEER